MVNEALHQWPVRMMDRSSFVRLLKGDAIQIAPKPGLTAKQAHAAFLKAVANMSEEEIASTLEHMVGDDWQKMYMSIALSKRFSVYTQFRDIRFARLHHWPKTLEKKGPGWEAFKDWIAKRRSGQVELKGGPYKVWNVCPFGLAPVVAWACVLGGEVMQMFSAWLIKGSPVGVGVIYVDDTAQRGDTKAQAYERQQRMGKLTTWLGFLTNLEKQQAPTRVMEFLGVVYDLNKLEIYMSPERNARLLLTINGVLCAGGLLFSALEELAGHMIWYSENMVGAATFTQGILNLFPRGHGMARLDKDQRKRMANVFIDLTPQANRHLHWWREHLHPDYSWPGARIRMPAHQTPVVVVKSDASGEGICGYVYRARIHWFYCPKHLAGPERVAWLELAPAVAWAEEYGENASEEVVRWGFDSTVACFAMYKRRSKNWDLQALLERLALLRERFRFLIVPAHTTRSFNELSDCATRAVLLQEYLKYLPPDVRLPDDLLGSAKCSSRTSPISSGPIFSLDLSA